KRAEGHAILGARDLDDIAAHLAQTGQTGSDALLDLVYRLIESATRLGIPMRRDPGPIHTVGICRIACRRPRRSFIRADTVAHIGESLKVDKIKTIHRVHCQTRVSAANTGDQRFAHRGSVSRHQMKTHSMIDGTPYEAGGSQKAVGRGNVNLVLSVNREARLARNTLVINDRLSSKQRNIAARLRRGYQGRGDN